MKPETVRRAIEEIKNLRQQTQLMNARLRMFDDMMSLFNTRGPDRGVCNGVEDVCWQLEMQLNEDHNVVLQRMGDREPLSKPATEPSIKRAKLD